MNRDFANYAKQCSLEAVASLSKILLGQMDKCSDQERDEIKKGVGLSIGHIQIYLLDVIYRKFPDMDDIK